MPEHPLPSDPTPTPPPEAVPLPTWQDWISMGERLGRIDAGQAALSERLSEFKTEVRAEIKQLKGLLIAMIIAIISVGGGIIAALAIGIITLISRLPAL